MHRSRTPRRRAIGDRAADEDVVAGDGQRSSEAVAAGAVGAGEGSDHIAGKIEQLEIAGTVRGRRVGGDEQIVAERHDRVGELHGAGMVVDNGGGIDVVGVVVDVNFSAGGRIAGFADRDFPADERDGRSELIAVLWIGVAEGADDVAGGRSTSRTSPSRICDAPSFTGAPINARFPCVATAKP